MVVVVAVEILLKLASACNPYGSIQFSSHWYDDIDFNRASMANKPSIVRLISSVSDILVHFVRLSLTIFSNFGAICLLAMLGTFIASIVTEILVWAVTSCFCCCSFNYYCYFFGCMNKICLKLHGYILCVLCLWESPSSWRFCSSLSQKIRLSFFSFNFPCRYLGGIFYLMYKMSFRESIMYGELCSATDPVSC